MTRAEIDRILETVSAACHAHIDMLEVLFHAAEVPTLERAEILEDLANDVFGRSEAIIARRRAGQEITA